MTKILFEIGFDMFSELCEIMMHKVVLVGFRGITAPHGSTPASSISTKVLRHPKIMTRCRRKQIFGSAKDFFPNLPKKLSSKFCGPFFGETSKKLSSLVFLQTLGAIFSQVFRDFA